MKLYIGPESGNSYKVRVLLSLLDVEHDIVVVELSKNQHKSAAFLKISPRGQVPVLVDGERTLWDSSACLVYIARRFGGEPWLPSDPAGLSEVVQWLALAGNEIQFGLQYARRAKLRGRLIAGTLEQLQSIGRIGLDVLEKRLAVENWLCFGRPTIADIACFAYAETADEAGIDLCRYPAVRAWVDRCKSLPKWPSRGTRHLPHSTFFVPDE